MKSLLVLLLLSVSLNANAFRLNNSAKLVFDKDEVQVNVAGGFCTNLGITDAEFLSIVSEAVDHFWNTSPTSRLKLRQGSVVSVAAAFNTGTICMPATNCDPNPALAVSNDILISCNTNAGNFTSSAILAVAIPNNISGNKIVGSLVLINDQASNQFSSKTREEKVAIVAHELGHTFGLGHSPVEDSLMYYATVASRRSLGRDDIDGISYLYPKQQPIKGGCGTIDLNPNNGPGDWWGGLFVGFALIGLAEIYRKKKSNQVQTA